MNISKIFYKEFSGTKLSAVQLYTSMNNKNRSFVLTDLMEHLYIYQVFFFLGNKYINYLGSCVVKYHNI